MIGKRGSYLRQANSLSRVRERAGVRALPRAATIPSPPTPLPKWERGEKQKIGKRDDIQRQADSLSRVRERAGVRVRSEKQDHVLQKSL